jgi:hypothetical protein
VGSLPRHRHLRRLAASAAARHLHHDAARGGRSCRRRSRSSATVEHHHKAAATAQHHQKRERETQREGDIERERSGQGRSRRGKSRRGGALRSAAVRAQAPPPVTDLRAAAAGRGREAPGRGDKAVLVGWGYETGSAATPRDKVRNEWRGEVEGGLAVPDGDQSSVYYL